MRPNSGVTLTARYRAPLPHCGLALGVVALAAHEVGRGGDEVVHRQRAEAELDGVAAGPDLDAAEQEVRAQDRPALAVDPRLPARVVDVVQDDDAVAVGLDRKRDLVAAVVGDPDRPVRRLALCRAVAKAAAMGKRFMERV